jgi:ornithine cyclodeaminase/alanine dehydrogenase-like protein (mu-crystallin family)
VKLLVPAGRDVHELLTYRECAEVMRAALAERARGRIQQPLRTIVRPRDAAGFMVLMPAYAPDAGYGLKAICITPGSPAAGQDAHQGGILLFDAPTGEPLALVNASAVTEIRTAATSAVATGLLARPGPGVAAIIGTGVQGRAHAHALAATGELTAIRLAGRDLDRARALAAELAGRLGLPVSESLGPAAEDLAAASFLYEKATRLGVGTAADFQPVTRKKRRSAGASWPASISWRITGRA